jgi:hypothetical protein
VRSTHVRLLADSWGRAPEVVKGDGATTPESTRQPTGD